MSEGTVEAALREEVAFVRAVIARYLETATGEALAEFREASRAMSRVSDALVALRSRGSSDTPNVELTDDERGWLRAMPVWGRGVDGRLVAGGEQIEAKFDVLTKGSSDTRPLRESTRCGLFYGIMPNAQDTFCDREKGHSGPCRLPLAVAYLERENERLEAGHEGSSDTRLTERFLVFALTLVDDLHHGDEMFMEMKDSLGAYELAKTTCGCEHCSWSPPARADAEQEGQARGSTAMLTDPLEEEDL